MHTLLYEYKFYHPTWKKMFEEQLLNTIAIVCSILSVHRGQSIFIRVVKQIKAVSFFPIWPLIWVHAKRFWYSIPSKLDP